MFFLQARVDVSGGSDQPAATCSERVCIDVYRRVLTCRAEVINLLPRVQSMCETVKEASRRLVTYQLQRQKDMWQLISASVREQLSIKSTRALLEELF